MELVKNSGFTDTGIYLYEYDDARDIHGRPIGMMVRVTETYKCTDIEPGKVYIIHNPYAFAEASREDGTDHRLVMSEKNFVAEIEGYDDEAERIADELDAERYPVCGKC